MSLGADIRVLTGALDTRTGRVWCSALLAAVVGFTLALVPVVDRAHALLGDDVRSDADWIMAAQLPDGAIASYVDRKAVWPYLANFAAMGLARAKEVTNDPKYTNAAWAWLGWYQAHQDGRGFVTDYTVTDNVAASTGDMDSTDSYAGTFLLAVRSTYRVTGDRTRLAGLRPGITAAVGAIEATQQPDGLTWAKPTWPVKYLMDQAETYAGLAAANELAQALGDSALALRAKADADRMATAVGKLWNAGTSAYDWAVHDTGARTATDWSYLYSDALQQAWVVAFGLADKTRGTNLTSKLTSSQPAWALPASTALFSGGNRQTVGYWPVAGMGFSLLGRPGTAANVASIRSASMAANRAWPYTTGNAGQLILFEAYSPSSSMLTGLPDALRKPLAGVTSPVLAAASPTATPKIAAQSAPTTVAAKPTASIAAAAPAPTPAPAATTGPTTSPLLNAQVGPVNLSASLGNQGVGVNLGLGNLNAKASLGPSGLGLGVGGSGP